MKRIFRILLPALLIAVLIIPILPATPALASETTFYSTASDGEIYTADSTVWATVRDATTGTVSATEATDTQAQTNFVTPNYNIHRSFLYFNTSSIPDDAVITNVVLSLFEATITEIFNTDTCTLVIQNGQPTYPTDPLAATDINRTYYSGNGGSVAFASIAANDYTGITLNADGRGWINKTGTTKLMLTTNRDIDNLAPTGYNYVVFYSSEDGGAGTTRDPKLVVTYSTLPEVTTGTATAITTTTATLNGNLDTLGGYTPVYVYFQYGLTTGYGLTTAEQSKTATGAFSADITDLTPGETYHFRAVVKYNTSYAYGSDDSFVATDVGTEDPWIIYSSDRYGSAVFLTLGDNLYCTEFDWTTPTRIFKYNKATKTKTVVLTDDGTYGFSVWASDYDADNNILWIAGQRGVYNPPTYADMKTFVVRWDLVTDEVTWAAVTPVYWREAFSIIKFGADLFVSTGSGIIRAPVAGWDTPANWQLVWASPASPPSEQYLVTKFAILGGSLYSLYQSPIGSQIYKYDGTTFNLVTTLPTPAPALQWGTTSDMYWRTGWTDAYIVYSSSATGTVHTVKFNGTLYGDVDTGIGNPTFGLRMTMSADKATTYIFRVNFTFWADPNIWQDIHRIDSSGMILLQTWDIGRTVSWTLPIYGGKYCGESLPSHMSGLSNILNYTLETHPYYATSSDGDIGSGTQSTWIAARDAATGTVSAGETTFGVQTNYTGTAYNIHKGYLYFNTAAVPDDAVITSATLKLFEHTTWTVYNADTSTLVVQNGQPTYPTDPLAATDFNRTYYSGNGGSFAFSSIVGVGGAYGRDGYSFIPLNATGISWINKTGTTKLMLTTNRDIDNLAPTGYNYVVFYSSEQAGIIPSPQLVLTYVTTPAPPDTPTVSTGSAVNITTTGATLQGTLTSLGDYTPVYVSFDYGLTTAFGSSTVEETKTAIGGFNKAITGLTSETKYYFRAKVRHDTSVAYGVTLDFTTTVTEGPPGEPGIDPPDILRIDDVKVFTNYLESDPGNQLYVIAYRIIYSTGTPILDVTDYFDFQLLDGTILKAQVPVKSWDYKPGSLYLASTSAPAWGGDYRIKIIGAPDKWETPPECYRDLTPGDWQGEDLTQLDTWVWSLAESLQNYYQTKFIEYLTGRQLLSDHGGYIFDMGIPGLSAVRPHLFSLISGYPDIDLLVDRGKEREEALKASSEERIGPYITGKLQAIADLLPEGTEVREVAGVGLALLYLVLALTIGAMAGNMLWGLSAAILVFGPGVYFGVITPTMIGVIAFVSVAIFIYQFWWKHA